MNIETLIRAMGFTPLDTEEGRGDIAQWRAWYKGYVREFHSYSVYNGAKRTQAQRASLGMAKKVCEDWANLLLNEKVSVTAEREAQSATLANVLCENDFYVQANRLVELAFALGTGAFVESRRGGKVRLDYIRAEYIYPLAAEGGHVTACAFGSERKRGGKKEYYIQVHEPAERGYRVHNALFDENGKRMPLSGVVETLESEAPLFQIITPNTVNARRTDSPFGASVFAGAIDAVRGTDLIYDSLLNEFMLGKKRIMVPASMAQLHSDDTGAHLLFDPRDTVFYAVPQAPDGGGTIQDIDMKLRVAEHTEGLERVLGLLSDRCGLGGDRYKWERGAVKTATEVISDKSELYQNLRKHELVLESALRGMAEGVFALLGEKTGEITVQFDDSIIEDKASEFAQYTALLSAGVLAPWEVRAWWTGESAEEARRACEEMAVSESAIDT